MSRQTNHRRILAAPDPQIPMDPTSRKPKPNPSAAAAALKNHRHPDPPSSTIQSISTRFSKLYINHKKIVSTDHPNSFSHTSCTTLTKSSSHHGRGGVATIPVEQKFVGTKDELKKNPPKNSSFSEVDVKNGSKLMAGEEKLKGFEEGGEKWSGGRNSVSSIPPRPKNGGGRRKSFCTSEHELADFFSYSGVKVVAVDMPPFMQIHAVNCARKAHDSLEKFTSKSLAFTLKKEFDGVYGPAWHCIVGSSFGSFVTHSVGGFMYFSMDEKLYILLFKTAVQRADH